MTVPLITLREYEVAELIVSRKCNKEIAVELGVSLSAIKQRAANLRRKTGQPTTRDASYQVLRICPYCGHNHCGTRPSKDVDGMVYNGLRRSTANGNSESLALRTETGHGKKDRASSNPPQNLHGATGQCASS